MSELAVFPPMVSLSSKITKLQWSFKKSTEAPVAVDVPDVFTQAFVIEKDGKRFPNTGGWETGTSQSTEHTRALSVLESNARQHWRCHQPGLRGHHGILHPS